MADIRGTIREFYALEQLAGKDTPVHRLHPAAKLMATVVYIITVVSFDRFQFRQLIPFLFYPAILLSLSETPWSLAMKRVALALPFVLLAGLSNLLLDRTPVLAVGNLVLTSGLISFASILLRTFLTVLALVLLMAVTPVADLTASLRQAHIPEVGIMLFEMTYRYIGVLLEEVSSMSTAYRLRHRNIRGLEMKHMGSFVGSLMLRSFDRADRIYSAMKCRGYGRKSAYRTRRPWTKADWAFMLLVCGGCVACRAVDVTAILGGLFV